MKQLGKFVSARRRNQHARRMRYLIIGSERLALAADSGAASVSCEVSEWGLVWVSVVTVAVGDGGG